MQSTAIMVGALALAGFNLRASLMAVAPLLPAIQSDLRMSSSAAGMIISLPVLLLGVAPLVGGWLARSVSAARLVALSMAGACVGTAIRSLAGDSSAGLACFALGTVVLGTCLGTANAMLPAIVKQLRAPVQAAAAGVLNVTLCVGAAVAAGVTPLLASLLGHRWQAALAVWILPAALCALVWWRLHRDTRHATPQTAPGGRIPWRPGPLAVSLGLNMAAQSFLSQATTTWLPTILESKGLPRHDAGALLATMMMAQLLTALIGPWIANRVADQRTAMAGMYLLGLAGFAACIELPAPWNWCAAVVLGLGQGGTFSVALHLVVLRARDSAQARTLAFSTQLIGYGISAFAPYVFGVLRDATGGWTFVLPAFALVTLAGVRAGQFAGLPPALSTATRSP